MFIGSKQIEIIIILILTQVLNRNVVIYSKKKKSCSIMTKEFRINQFLSLRLECGQTMIYVAGEEFIQCKSLLLDIPVAEISSLEMIDSIDEAVQEIENFSQRNMNRTRISPEVEFWGHCSNLQTWYEHDYDTRLLHSNLAFSLLGKLTEVGDTLAKGIFKTELINRYENGTDKTREYIRDSKALGYLSKEEILNLMLKTEDLIALTEFAEEVWVKEDPYKIIFALMSEEEVKLENRKVTELDLSGIDLELEKFPESVLKLKSLKKLVLRGNYFREIPENISELNILKELWLNGNEISHLPDSICHITSLERLEVGGNKIHALPKNIGDLKLLRSLGLGSNEITNLPDPFYKLESLETLSLADNKLNDLPETFCNLASLKWLSLSNNKLSRLPECFLNLKSLEYLDISKNPLTESQELLEKIKKLRIKSRF